MSRGLGRGQGLTTVRQTPPWNAPWGMVPNGFATTSVAQGTITATVDATSLTVTFNMIPNRRYRITGVIRVNSSVTTDTGLAIIDLFGVGTQAQVNFGPFTTAEIPVLSCVTNASFSGSQTWRLRVGRLTGTGNLSLENNVTSSYILVEDIGPLTNAP